MADITGQLQAAAGAGGEEGNPNAWDISKAYYDVGADAGDISKAFYTSHFISVASQETSPTGVYISPNGTKMYVVGQASDNVNEYTLSTAWLVSSATFVQSFSILSQDTSSGGIFFKPDGTKMYVIGLENDSVYEYDLSTAWNVSTASYLQSFSVATENAFPVDLFFKPDGTKMYMLGATDDEINEYDLSTAWDVTTASYVQNFGVGAQEGTPQGLAFLSDGTKMYVTGANGDDVNEYTLSTPWDISTASFVTSFLVSSEETSPQGLFFKPDGSMFYLTGSGLDRVYQYGIGGFSVAAEETNPSGVFFKPDGTKMYVVGAAGDDVNEYDLSTAWDISTASYVQNFSVATEDTAPNALFFKDDGLKMYVLGITNDAIYQYTLSTAWDISTASYDSISFSIASEELTGRGLFFKPDGTKMYVCGGAGDDVNEYSLSTAWDVSSASYVQNFSVAVDALNPTDLFFKPDGTIMYVLAANVAQYALATPWNISTASHSQTFTLSLGSTTGFYFRGNGEEFYIVDQTPDKIFNFKISPE